MITKSEKEVQEQCDKAIENPNIYPAMTYSDGVQAALNWVLGVSDTPPIEED